MTRFSLNNEMPVSHLHRWKLAKQTMKWDEGGHGLPTRVRVQCPQDRGLEAKVPILFFLNKRGPVSPVKFGPRSVPGREGFVRLRSWMARSEATRVFFPCQKTHIYPARLWYHYRCFGKVFTFALLWAVTDEGEVITPSDNLCASAVFWSFRGLPISVTEHSPNTK